ncbi:MAG TPA: hypothetical protein VFM46_16275 [Pseudomonadales bacterium]|nr:hypothetical protein [Pseudomonadales bacterium]
MTLDLTTFVLQILNFLVLLWLLRRFVYLPLQQAIAKRQADAAAAEAALRQKMQAVEAQQAALQAQQDALTQAKQAAEAALAEEIAKQRAQRLAVLEKELASLREHGEARLQAQWAARQAESAQQLRQQVDAAVRQHLERLANPALEAVLIDQFLDELKRLDAATKADLQALVWQEPVEVSTAYPFDPIQLARVETSLSELRNAPVHMRWRQEARLLAGIRVGLDGKELELSLAHSLEVLPEALSPALKTEAIA